MQGQEWQSSRWEMEAYEQSVRMIPRMYWSRSHKRAQGEFLISFLPVGLDERKYGDLREHSMTPPDAGKELWSQCYAP